MKNEKILKVIQSLVDETLEKVGNDYALAIEEIENNNCKLLIEKVHSELKFVKTVDILENWDFYHYAE